MEKLSQEELNQYLFDRKPAIHSRLIDYEDISISFAKSLKERITGKIKHEDGYKSEELIDISLMSNHYYHMMVSNWRVLCFKNEAFIIKLLKLYKVVTSLVCFVDGLNVRRKGELGIEFPLGPFKNNVFLVQKWMFELLNSLEAFLVKSYFGTEDQDFPIRVYISLALYHEGIDNIGKCLSKLNRNITNDLIYREAEE